MHYVGGNKVSVVRSLTQFTIVFYEFQFKVGVTLFFFTNWSNGQEAEILNDKTLDMKHNWKHGHTVHAMKHGLRTHDG